MMPIGTPSRLDSEEAVVNMGLPIRSLALNPE